MKIQMRLLAKSKDIAFSAFLLFMYGTQISPVVITGNSITYDSFEIT